MIKKRVPKGEGDVNKTLASVETKGPNWLAPLIEHCSARAFDDGSSRQPGWLTIRTVGATWEVVVKDPESATSFKAVGETVDRALESAALLLGCEDAPWEHDQWLVKDKGRKGK